MLPIVDPGWLSNANVFGWLAITGEEKGQNLCWYSQVNNAWVDKARLFANPRRLNIRVGMHFMSKDLTLGPLGARNYGKCEGYKE